MVSPNGGGAKDYLVAFLRVFFAARAFSTSIWKSERTFI